MNDSGSGSPLREDFDEGSGREVVIDDEVRQLCNPDPTQRRKPHLHEVIGNQAWMLRHERRVAVGPFHPPLMRPLKRTEIDARQVSTKDKMAAPGYQAILDRDIPSVALPEGAGAVRVIAGEYDGHKGPARTFTPLDVWDVRLKAGGGAAFTLPEDHTLAVVVLTGTVEFNGEHIAREAQVVLFERAGGAITLAAGGDAKLLVRR